MTTDKLNRRELLKLAGALSLGVLAPRFMYKPADINDSVDGDQKNVLIVVFDAFSAYHIPFYGHARNTMPNVSKLIKRAVIYHDHYSAGNYTTPGTASLLTGTLPWTHRALGQNTKVAKEVSQRNIFNVFPNHHRMTYSHNRYVNTLLRQFMTDIDDYTSREELFIEELNVVGKLFANDDDAATIAWVRALNKWEEGVSYSLYLSQLNAFFQARKEERLAEIKRGFPRGIPHIKKIQSYYLLEGAIDHLANAITGAIEPYLGYYHFLPPHDPYNTRSDFYNAFRKDGYIPPEKPDHLFSGTTPDEKLVKWSTWYDEYILYVNSEFARLYDYMDQNGFLENTWLILTSDHGELFERGLSGHVTEMLFQPVIRIPLLIFEPGRTSRLDIFDSTSNIDILPTLLHLTNQETPDWLEGKLLPPFENMPKNDKDVFAFESKITENNEPIQGGTAVLVRGNYKLVYYFGYEELGESREMIELYDVKNDPDEFENLYPTQKAIADELLAVVQSKINAANQPYL